MKFEMKKNEFVKISDKSLKRRLFSSLLFGVIFFSLITAGFIFVREDKTAENTAQVLRQSFQRNEKVARKLFSKNKFSASFKPPTKGTPPRANGMIGLESAVDWKNYKISVQQNQKSISVSMADIYKLKKSEATTDFKCVEGWSEIVHYAGVRFSDFVSAFMVGVNDQRQNYQYVGLETPDGEYYVSIDMDSMLHDQTILAYEMNGVPLSLENGYPIRLIIPTKYGIKSLKRIGRIFFSDIKPPDYWAEQGYDWYSGL